MLYGASGARPFGSGAAVTHPWGLGPVVTRPLAGAPGRTDPTGCRRGSASGGGRGGLPVFTTSATEAGQRTGGQIAISPVFHDAVRRRGGRRRVGGIGDSPRCVRRRSVAWCGVGPVGGGVRRWVGGGWSGGWGVVQARGPVGGGARRCWSWRLGDVGAPGRRPLAGQRSPVWKGGNSRRLEVLACSGWNGDAGGEAGLAALERSSPRRVGWCVMSVGGPSASGAGLGAPRTALRRADPARRGPAAADRLDPADRPSSDRRARRAPGVAARGGRWRADELFGLRSRSSTAYPPPPRRRVAAQGAR